jgi:4'-phosphopantetheinyl transferase EntD
VALVVLFDWDLPLGRCVGVRLASEPSEGNEVDSRRGLPLLDAEWQMTEALPPRRRRPWIAGRAAIRIALAREGMEAPAVGHDDRGAPVLPAGCAGSISHKEVRRADEADAEASWAPGDVAAVALVRREFAARLGVDVELDRRLSADIASRVLTGGEETGIAGMDQAMRSREVLLRFSAKEAIYKAVDPYVRRYVGFKEVGVTPRPDGSADVTWHLDPQENNEGLFDASVLWRRVSGLVVTMARVGRRC